jgi:uncharacterized Rossmann fold enzyme
MIFETKGTPFHELEDLDFSIENWLEHWYPKICKYLEIDASKDLSALVSISKQYSSNQNEEDLGLKITGKDVIILAPGINLEEEFKLCISKTSLVDKILISADGATSFLLSLDIIPALITSDIDGNVVDQILAQKQGSTILLHVHGDNTSLVEENIEAISKKKFVITTQSKPVDGTFNFLGFTDGDRAVCLSTLMKAKSVTLIGFDFGEEIGKFSKDIQLSKEKKERKLKKFTVAKSIINWCAKAGLEIVFPKKN